jgi:hypothetical protein
MTGWWCVKPTILPVADVVEMETFRFLDSTLPKLSRMKQRGRVRVRVRVRVRD